MLRFLRAAPALLVLAAACALVACSASPAESSATAVTAPPGCKNVLIAEMLAGFRTVELAAAAGTTIPGDRRTTYRKMAEAVEACAMPGTRITVRPITERALAEIPIFAELVPDRIGENAYNPHHYRVDRTAYITRAAAALDALPRIGAHDNGSDPLGALLAASRNLDPNAKSIVILICNGWQQTRDLNVFAYRTDPARYSAGVIRKLTKDHALPDLSGVQVVIAGITAGAPGIDINDTQLDGLCRFWHAIVASAHGELLCSPTLPGITQLG